MGKRESSKNSLQHEDAVLKTCMHFFAEELLPYWGIEGKVTAFAPTELIQLDIQKLYQDFNLVMEDGTWKHFEFQSANEGTAGMRRFRAYEALAGYHHKVEVTTYVLYSGTIKEPMTELTEGINTYRVVPIIMREYDARALLEEISRKVDNGILLGKGDLFSLALCPLMGGNMAQKERIRAAYKILGNAQTEFTENIKKLEAVIYAMADKFLGTLELKEIEEEIRMTRLGQMLVNEGIERGRVKLIVNMLKKGYSYEEISDIAELTVSEVKQIEKAALM